MSNVGDREFIGVVMTNFDHSIKEDVALTLQEREGEAYGQYSGWNFCGSVWYDDGMWVCEVWQYHQVVGEVREETLEDIMSEVCDKWGAD